jgi:hypothetical protein
MEEISTLLDEFIAFVKNKVDEALRKEEIKKLELNQNYFKWKIDKFEYSMDSGLSYGATGQYFAKTQIIYSHNLDTKLTATSEFKAFVDKLKEI